MLHDWPGQPSSFDSEAGVDLQAPGGPEGDRLHAALRRKLIVNTSLVVP
jgi:hypothetical protein